MIRLDSSRRILLSRAAAFICSRSLLFLRLILFARLFSKQALGEYALMSSYFLGFAALSDWGFHQRVLARSGAPREDYDDLFSFALLLSLLAVALSFLLAPYFAAMTGIEFHSSSLGLAGFILGSSLLLPRAVAERRDKLILVSFSRLCPELVSLVAAVTIEETLHLGAASIFIGVSSGLAASMICVWIPSSLRPSFSLENLHAQFERSRRFGTHYSLYQTGQFASERLDTFFVGLFAGAGICGAYSICWSISSIIPAILLNIEEGAALAKNLSGAPFDLTRSLRAGIFLGQVVLLLLIVFAREVLTILLGPTWAEYADLLRLFSIAGMIRVTFLTGIFAESISQELPKRLGRYSLVTMSLLLTFGYCLIRAYGALGGGVFWVLHAVLAALVFSNGVFSIRKDGSRVAGR